MKTRKTLSVVAGIGAMAAGITLAFPGSAGAATAVTICKDINYGSCTSFPTTASNLKTSVIGAGSWNDAISSIQPVPVKMCFYENTDYGGSYVVFPAGDSSGDLRKVTFIEGGSVLNWNDRISSFKPC
ncbi:peptidase inhibitor family I36 protein [Streptomyces sp. NPDC050528]|uniref:peptidase inhibitor family I36 protein n=1 Tax=Streptomyces sp. NPDC050528 TaxID=3365623 RepID=UPI00378D8AC1